MKEPKLPPEMRNHCHITMRVIDRTGQPRQLTAEEIEERLRKVLAIPLEERIRQSIRNTR